MSFFFQKIKKYPSCRTLVNQLKKIFWCQIFQKTTWNQAFQPLVRMAATRRLQKELQDIRKAGLKSFRDIIVDESNILQWTGLLVPDCAPYSKGAFKIEIIFPAEYPFKPPKLCFKTKIYHPNVDEKGQVCLPIVSVENWKPATKTDQVINALVSLINEPEPDHPLRGDLAEEYSKDRKKFMKNAEEFTKKHGEKRPSD